MQLKIWYLPQIFQQVGFSIVEVVHYVGDIRLQLSRTGSPSFLINFCFSNHLGVLLSSEFGMDRYLEAGTASGSNFMMSDDSQFLEFCRKGSLEKQDWTKVKSYIFVDNDRWIEILAEQEPRIEVNIS